MTSPDVPDSLSVKAEAPDRNLALELVRVTEPVSSVLEMMLAKRSTNSRARMYPFRLLLASVGKLVIATAMVSSNVNFFILGGYRSNLFRS